MKRYSKILLGLLSLLLIISSCKKDDKGDKERTLDANFSFDIKPDPGTELTINLYYTDDEGESFYERTPDEVVTRILSETDIANGFTHTFQDFKQSSFAYITAYADLDNNKQLSEGDIAISYFNKSLREVMKGNEMAENASHRFFVTMKMDRLYSTLRTLDVDFTFPIPAAVNSKLKLQLYYAQEEENNFFERQPDLEKTTTLTQEDITNGVSVNVNNLEDVPFLYAIAYVDVDNNGSLNHGDIAVTYDNKSVSDVFDGKEQAGNIGSRSNIALNLSQFFINTDDLLKDIDGNSYTSVVVGNKVWMVENLKVTKYSNGESIPTGLSSAAWSTATSSYYAIYPYTEATGITSENEMIAKYGLLYNGFAVIDPRGLAPAGWRVATDQDYKDLEIAIGFSTDQADALNWRGVNNLQLRNVSGWPINPGTNDLGLSMLPAGVRNQSGAFQYFNIRANLWTQTGHETNQGVLYRRIIEDNRSTNINRSTVTKREGYSVRCVRDL